MSIEQVLQLLDSALRVERESVEEYLRRRELWRAAEAQSRYLALQAFRETVVTQLSPED